MRYFLINSSRPKSLIRLVFTSAVLSSSSFLVFGQAVNPDSAKQPATESRITQQVDSPATRNKADETFELNIAERHYSQESFEASTAVETRNVDNLNLQVGVALASGRIDVTLRNVHGRVRFRGTLDSILELFNNRQVLSPIAPAPAPVRPPE